MVAQFDLEKTIQASAVLLRHSPQMSRLRLLKLLYIADRESLKDTGHSITGDDAVAMESGPVPRRAFDLLSGEGPGVDCWAKHIVPLGKRDLRLDRDPGTDALSVYEMRKLQEVADRYDAVDDWSVAEETHEYSEWIKNYHEKGSSHPIPVEDILEAVGLGEYTAELLREAQEYAEFDRLLAQARR